MLYYFFVYRNTSTSTYFSIKAETPKKKKLKEWNLKLQAKNKMLCERIRRLKKE